MSTRSLSRIPFDPREGRVVAGLARWMGLLGRFQIVAAVFVFVLLLAVTGVVTTVELFEPVAEGGEEPLVKIGEVSREAIAAVVGVVVVLSLIFLRGGMLLLSAADDLEVVGDSGGGDQAALEGALRRVRSYFMLESFLMVLLLAAVYAAAIAGWGP